MPVNGASADPSALSVPFSGEPAAEGGGELRRRPRAGPGGGSQRAELGGLRGRGGGGGSGGKVGGLGAVRRF